MKTLTIGLTLALLHFAAFAAEIPQKDQQASNTTTSANISSVRESRPFAVSASGVGRTPFFGVMADINLFPALAVGAGFGAFSSGSVSGSFIPLYAQAYLMTDEFTPYAFAGASFLTVKFDSPNRLLRSSFEGTQAIAGAGVEYRFSSGLNLRIDLTRFINAKIWAPGVAVGYAFGAIR